MAALDVKIKYENDDKKEVKVKIENEESRKDPTSFLPEEPMSYEIKKKKKKKKRLQEDPFKDIDDKMGCKIEPMSLLDPEVKIKVEDIEVELDFNDFGDTGLVEGPHSEESQEPTVKIEPNNHEAVLLTFESVISQNSLLDSSGIYPYKSNLPTQLAPTHVCKVCHLVFQSQKTLRMHQKRKHKSFRKYFKHICDYCGMSYEMKNSLVAHIKRKHGPDSLPDDREERTCDICALVFKGMTRLRMHMRRKHGAFQDSFKHVCDDCGLTYDKYRSLIVHIQRKHSHEKKPEISQWYNCPFCPKMFTKRETYARHVQRKHHVSEENVQEEAEYFRSCKNEETGEITCKECPLVFSSINYLKLHMRRKHNALREDFRLKCRICNLSYDKIESLKRHVRRKHDKGSHCEVCNKQFDTRELYLNHSHMKEIKECNICGLIFASQGGLAKHLRCTHKIASPKIVFCNICNEGFHDKRQLKPHLMKVHLKVSYTCIYCKKVFKAKESYRRHIFVKHPSVNHYSGQLQKCDQCNETFKDEFDLCKHINVVHGQTDDSKEERAAVDIKNEDPDIKNHFQCTKCPEIFMAWDQLKLHYEANHHNVEETQCQICGQILPGNELQKHIKALHTDTEMQCKYCEFKTNVRVSLTQHMLRHKNAETIHCDYTGCKYKTFYEGAMEKHKRKHADQGVKLQCTQCPFQTMNKYILKYHEEAHETGKKRYMCDQCEYATILPANLVQHKYKHSTEKRFKCEVCPFATKYNTSLRFHVRKKHCDLPTFN
ncbi:zinc finger protein 26-like [Helicoverpa zea]|uniref:zinc finger protein 26-like n=1 Tax=Helicoverpa zea TaxID=7113 RepID=UPI001F5821E9|nr:zinc finger protein 26-like [Helicoverpa zea]XP_047037809.1 zinc finger protein 26-like [Helicoverpa zea]